MPKRDGTPTLTDEILERLKIRIDELRKIGLTIPDPLKGQVSGNKICIDLENPAITTEFGDFHVSLAKRHIIVEIDGSGIDLTNLIKHWYVLHTHFNEPPVNSRPITLLHVYSQKRGKDLHSRVIYWKFVYSQIQQEQQYVGKFDAKLYPVRTQSTEQDKENDIQAFLDVFTACLRGAIVA